MLARYRRTPTYCWCSSSCNKYRHHHPSSPSHLVALISTTHTHTYIQQHPPVLPKLQELALESEPRIIVEGFDTTYYEDMSALRGFGVQNQCSIGELLVRFFRFYAYEFDYANKVVAPRTGGFFTKEQKQWQLSRKVSLSLSLLLARTRSLTHSFIGSLTV